ncbi:MAG: glycosyltransferase family 2 protein [Lachnospiraceae bacterium]|nr:glycosyltransferase family 2 protein [Lachnospiraceae bacterium]
MNVKISVIVPAFNVERYIEKTLESLVKQTLEEIEIIVVDDGSTDGTQEILMRYQQAYSDKLRIFTIENEGVSHARNVGVRHAKGEYVMFVDSDDYIAPNMCELLFEQASKYRDDLVVCNRYDVYDEKIVERECNLSLEHGPLVSHPEEYLNITPFPWDKLYKKDLFLQVGFKEGIRFEDLLAIFLIATKAKSISVVKEPLYYYRRTSVGGFLNSLTEETLDIITAFDTLIATLKKEQLYETYETQLEYMCIRHFCARYQTFFSMKEKGSLSLKCRLIDETQQFLEKQFPNWRENPYIFKCKDENVVRHFKYYQNAKKLKSYVRIRHMIPNWLLKGIKSGLKLCKKATA